MLLRRPSTKPGDWHQRSDRPRVLIENHDAAHGMAYQRILVEEGFEVSYCEGPSSQGGRCPLVHDGTCERAADADVVFSGLRLGDDGDREVLASLRQQFPNTPVVVEIPAPKLERYRDELEGCLTISQPATRARLVQVIRTALAGPEADVRAPRLSGDVVH